MNGTTKSNMKYSIIGSETQVAATEAKCNLNLARRVFKPAKFSNGHKALVVATVNTKRDANLWLSRSQSALAFVSGRLGRWLTPTFVAVETRELASR
jgi:hypothetical protein